jgi:hypothetical protein
LAGIPLLIHLLYRRQYRRVEWAPMQYLKLSIQRNRRRVRLEQILLLLVRTCLVLLLFFLVARPVMHAAGLSRLWGGDIRTNRIVVLDDSLSMAYSVQGQPALARAQSVLADLLGTFGEKDRLTLVLASRPQHPLLREVEIDDAAEIIELTRKVASCEASDAWQAILPELDKLIEAGSYPLHEVSLITDLRAASWDLPLSEIGDHWSSRQVRLRVIDVGTADTSNVALLNLRQLDRLALVDMPTRLEAEIHNASTGELGETDANLVVDGQATLVRVPGIEANQTLRIPLVVTFNEPGTHQVELRLPDDALTGDNQRYVLVQVQPSVDMLLINGEPSTEPLGGATDFLALALTLAGTTTEPFRVEVLSDTEWSASSRAQPDLIALANVPQLNADQVAALERWVNDGTGLVVFVGDQVDPDNYNQLLYQDGSGLLGAALLGIADGEFSGLLVEDRADSPLEAVGQLSPAALNRIKVRQIYEVNLPPGEAEGVHVLARWNNAASAPAVVQKTLGRGQTLLWTVSADRSWSDWPTDASYVLAMRESARAIARSAASLRQFTSGQVLTVDLPERRDITLPAVTVPGNDEQQPLVIVEQVGGSANGSNRKQHTAEPARQLSFDETWQSGFYTMQWRDSLTGLSQQVFAINPERRESNLAKLETEEFKSRWGSLDPEVVSLDAATTAGLSLQGVEIWRTLAMGLLGLLVFETCFARWCGRQR